MKFVSSICRGLLFFTSISISLGVAWSAGPEKSAGLPPPRFLDDAQGSTGQVTGFLVNPDTGALTLIEQGAVSAGSDPAFITGDHAGRHLYVSAENTLSAYLINRNTGVLTPAPGSPYSVGNTAGDAAYGVAVAPSGKFVYVVVANGGSSGEGVVGFSVGSDGSLTQIAGSPFPTTALPRSIVVDPSGQYVYVGHSAIYPVMGYDLDAFSIDRTSGALTPVPGEPFEIPIPSDCYFCGGGGVYDLAIDHTGTYLFAPVSGNGTIAVYGIDGSDGSLSAVPDSPYVISEPNSPTFPGAEPSSIALDPANRVLYVNINTTNADGQQSRNAIAILPFDASTGNFRGDGLHWIRPGICDQESTRIDPSGSFLYSAALSDCQQYGSPVTGPGDIVGFAVNQKTGILTTLPASPFAIPGDPNTSIDNITITP